MTTPPKKDLADQITSFIGTPESIVIHTLFFIGIFGLWFFGFTLDQIMLILTTAVSLEAIYLSLFIQMTVNRNTASLTELEKDVEEIQEDVEEIEGDFGEIQEDVKGIEEQVGEITEDLDNIQVEPAKPKEKSPYTELHITYQSIAAQLAKMESELGEIKKELHSHK